MARANKSEIATAQRAIKGSVAAPAIDSTGVTSEHQDHRDADSDSAAVAADSLFEDSFDWSGVEIPRADIHGFNLTDLEVALRDHALDLEGSPGDSEKPGDPKEADLPGSGGRTQRKEVNGQSGTTPSITSEDFEEGMEREAFIIIQEYYRVMLNADSKVTSRLKALEFFFCPSTPSRISFDETLAAIDPNIRSDVFRLRLMFEFWNRWTLFGGALPEEALDPPDRVLTQAAFHGDEAVTLVTEAWFNPGITTGELLELCRTDPVLTKKQRDKIPATLNTLLSNYILSEKHNSVYCTGKNPILETQDSMMRSGRVSGARAANVSWSRLF